VVLVVVHPAEVSIQVPQASTSCGYCSYRDASRVDPTRAVVAAS
jgi:hypothetical protein